MSIARSLERLFRGKEKVDRSDELDREIEQNHKRIIQNSQAIESGARVMRNMDGAMRLIMRTEHD